MINQKDKFLLSPDICYLNCAYMSPLLKSVEEAGIEGVRAKRNPFLLSPEDFFDPIEEVRSLFASLLHIDAKERVAIAPSVSYAMSNVAINTKIGRGENIVLADEQFPSNYYVWKKLADESGAELRLISPPAEPYFRGRRWNEGILSAIDQNTRVVALGHVHWSDGTVFLLKSISEAIHKVGGILVVDGTQSFGAYPFDQSEINADVIVASGYKWLMGPYGIAIAYYNESFDQGRPIEESWMNRLNSDDFARLVDYRDEYRRGAKRYEVGEASNFIHIPMMTEGLKQVNDWDPGGIQHYCESISKKAVETMRAEGLWIERDEERANHLFGIRLPESMDMSEVKAELVRNKVVISIRGNAIRVAPHLYNSEDDMGLLTSILLKHCKLTYSH